MDRKSVAANAGIPLNEQTAYASSSRAGQWYNGQGYVGFSSPSYGTLTVLRQNSLTLDAVIDYDPLGASYAFSPIGYQGITCGGGNTENCRHSTSLKYRLKLGDFRVAALWQFGGYEQNNSSIGAYQAQAGGDIAMRGNGVLSVDAIYSYVTNAVGISLGPGSNDARGSPIPPFLPQTLTATISDNEAVMLVAKYADGPWKLYAGYEHIRYMAPSDPQSSFTNIAGDFICQGCQAFNNTNISNTAFGVNGLGDKILQVMWTGAKYAITNKLDVMVGYYHYDQNNFFGTATGGSAPCSGAERSQCAGTFNGISAAIDWRFATEVGSLHGVHVLTSQWRIGQRLSPAQQYRSDRRSALPFLSASVRARVYGKQCFDCDGEHDRRTDGSATGTRVATGMVDVEVTSRQPRHLASTLRNRCCCVPTR